jgi:hypothetical protein
MTAMLACKTPVFYFIYFLSFFLQLTTAKKKPGASERLINFETTKAVNGAARAADNWVYPNAC